MNPGRLIRSGRKLPLLPLLLALALPVVLGGCSGRDLASLDKATAEADPVVFDDAFGNTLDFAAFGDNGAYTATLSQDQSVSHTGRASLKFEVPGGAWAGGTFWTHSPRDLSGYNALVFYARASKPLNLDACGIGLVFETPSTYQTTIANIPLTDTEWTRVVLPIPDASRLTSERGMFWCSEAEGGETVYVWFDDVRFAYEPNISNPRPQMNGGTVEALLGEEVPITGTKTTFTVGDDDVVVSHTPYYFDYFSSDEAVATAADGVVTVVGGGTTTISAKLAGVDASGQLTVDIPPPPSGPAPVPTLPAGDVISLFSDAYTDVNVDTWLAQWSNASGVYDQQVDGDNVKVYTGLTSAVYYASIDFGTSPIDAAGAGMTHFHLDVWATSGSLFYLELVDFGANGVFGGGDDTKKKVLFYDATTPSFAAEQWSSLDVPLSLFTGMNFGAVAQFNIQTADGNVVYVDNVYFHK